MEGLMKKTMEKLMSWLMITMMVVGMTQLTVMAAPTNATADVWDGTIATAFNGGTGTQEDPYQIATAAQLAYFSDGFTKADAPTFESSHVVLTNNIDLNNIKWTPIGNYHASSNSFGGVFDGQGYTVSNMSVTVDTKYQVDTNGLFGISSATIKNLNVKGEMIVNADGDYSFYGGIVGYLEGNIDNCTADVEMTFNGIHYNTCWMGGLVGYLGEGATLSNSINYGNITDLSTVSIGARYVGGVVGAVERGTVISCKNEGNISSDISRVGGIVGSAYNGGNAGYSEITNCYNAGVLTSNAIGAHYTGGIVGEVSSVQYTSNTPSGVKINNCFSTGSLNGSSASMGAVYGRFAIKGEPTSAEIISSNLFYLNSSVSANPALNDQAVEVMAINTPEFLAQISAGSGAGAWATDMNGNVILAMELADTTALQTAIANAKNAKDIITENDGAPSSVAYGSQFVSTLVMMEFNNAIAQAEKVVNTATTDVQVTDAISALETAQVAFTNSIQTGTLKNTQVLTFAEESIVTTVGATIVEPILNGAKTNVIYTSGNTKVATVNSATGEVTVVGAGTVRITATAEKSLGYESATASYNITVDNGTISIGADETTIFEGNFPDLDKVILNNINLNIALNGDLSGYPGYTLNGGVIGKVYESSIGVTLYKEFLAFLPAGEYTLSVTTTTGAGTTSATTMTVPEKTSHSLTINNAGNGTSGTSIRIVGEIITINAGARDGYTFSGWTATGVTLDSVSTNSTQFVMMPNDATITANWTASAMPSSGEAPDTSDSNNSTIWMMVALVGAMGMVCLTKRQFKK